MPPHPASLLVGTRFSVLSYCGVDVLRGALPILGVPPLVPCAVLSYCGVDVLCGALPRIVVSRLMQRALAVFGALRMYCRIVEPTCSTVPCILKADVPVPTRSVVPCYCSCAFWPAPLLAQS